MKAVLKTSKSSTTAGLERLVGVEVKKKLVASWIVVEGQLVCQWLLS
jgi:hypothetical protein